MAAIQDSNQLSSFLKELLGKGKAKFLSNLGIERIPKYVQSMKMFENLRKIASGLCKEVETDQTAELGRAAPDFIFFLNFAAPEAESSNVLRNICFSQYFSKCTWRVAPWPTGHLPNNLAVHTLC